MPRMMSFALTTQQFKDRTKDVTRRCAWWNLKPGDVLMAVEKAQGLKKGEKVKKLGLIEVVSTRAERLDEITHEECIREGFPDYGPAGFMAMFCLANDVYPVTEVNRIEFKYLESNHADE